jgi:hypothetical protein
MQTFIFKWLTAVFAVMLVSSLISMMAAFIGSEGEDERQSRFDCHPASPGFYGRFVDWPRRCHSEV